MSTAPGVAGTAGAAPATTTAAQAAGPGTAPLVAVRGLRRSFGAVVALDDVSLDIRENEFFALLGPSGCGKTTLLRVLAGFEAPDAGSVELDGRDLLAVPAHRRPVNLMFQSYALFPHMTVAKNVAYGLEREGLGRAEVRARVADVLDAVGLAEQAGRRPHQLSGGQRQRVALARAVVKRPRLLLLDEPLSALDRKVRAGMQLELKRLQHEVGTTFVVVTHDQEEAMSMADRIAVLRSGRVQQVASPVELYRRPATLFVADFVGDSNLFAGTAVDGGAGGVDVPALGRLPGAPAAGRVSGQATLVLRPEDAVLVGPGQGWLVGRVLETQFAGGTSTVAVEVAGPPGGASTTVTVTRAGAPDVARGTDVGVRWDPPRAVVLAGWPS